jgi:calcineurin-like phosphoesterase family protein
MDKIDNYYKLDLLHGIKKVVLGNHDMPQHVPELLKYVDRVGGAIDYKGYSLTHIPIHPCELSFYRGNIHAHIHHRNKLEEVYVMEEYGDTHKVQYPTLHKYANVDAKLIDYKPKTLEELFPNKYE